MAIPQASKLPKYGCLGKRGVVAFRPKCFPLKPRRKLGIILAPCFKSHGVGCLFYKLSQSCFLFIYLHCCSTWSQTRMRLKQVSILCQVAKKPKKGDKVPKKGKMVEGKTTVVSSWGTIRHGPRALEFQNTCLQNMALPALPRMFLRNMASEQQVPVSSWFP